MTWQTTPKKVVFADGLGDTMARVFPHTGIIQLNAQKWHTLPEAHQAMILLHEKGHLAMRTANEFDADAWAFAEYMKQGGSPKQALLSLTANLPYTTQEQLARTRAQFVRSVQYDAHHNHNPKAKALMQTRIYKDALVLQHTGKAANNKRMDAGLASMLGQLIDAGGKMAAAGTFDNENIKIAKANAGANAQAAQERLAAAQAKQLEAQNRSVELANAETRRIENSTAQAQQARLNTPPPATDTTTTKTKDDKGMPVWGWVLIGVGVLGALGTAAYFAFFKK